MVILSNAGNAKTKATVMFLILNKIAHEVEYIDLDKESEVLEKYHAEDFPICIPPDGDFWFGYDTERLASLLD